MGLSFVTPILLVLIPLILGGIIYSSKWLTRMTKGKRRWLIALRSVIASLLILCLAGTSLFWKTDTVTTIFLVDASDSTLLKRGDIETFVKEAVNFRTPKDRIGVLSFGENTQIESFIAKDPFFSKIEGKINGNFTNIENAVTTALSLFPANSNKRLVLITDGEENAGAASKIAISLQEQGIELKYHNIEKQVGEEAAVEKLAIPEKLVLDEEFNIVVTVSSTVEQNAVLHLFSGRTKVGEQKIQLSKGANRFVFKDKASTGGFKSYRVSIEADKDNEVKNNEASAFTNITAKPKVLIIQDTDGEAGELVKMLQASSVDYTLTNAKSAPRTLSEMTGYKSIVTCNVSADNLNEGFLNSLESYVKDFGGGFIATGGDNSFALGGYSRTSLEKVLPVYMDMRGKKEVPQMAMMLIIDKSGSMTEGVAGISRVDMAKEAAIRSLSSLRVNKDEIGVLAFDGAWSWVTNRQVIKDVKAIEDDIGTIRADGGTSILPALQEGYNSLKQSAAKIKHVILLTDGQAERTGYDQLLKDMTKDNITVSTVAVGKGADVELLEFIAKNCGGRHYVTDEYTNIPRIFSKETFMAARAYLNNREFTPVISSNHVVLKGAAEAGLPPLLGYVGASEKETARVVLRSDEDDPILTVWQYGLGKAAAWNSDVSGKWNANYIPWDKNLKLWQNIINFTVENYDNENASMEISAQGGKATITYKDKKNEKEMDTSAVVAAPSGVNTEVKLYPSAPGEYSAVVDLKENGTYLINGKQTQDGQIVNAVNAGYSMQYSPEYKINSSGEGLKNLVSEIGGSIITAPKEVFSGDIAKKKGSRDLTPYLLAAALILLMFDIALRRLNINTYKLKEFFKKFRFSREGKKDKKLRKPKVDFREAKPVLSYEVPEAEVLVSAEETRVKTKQENAKETVTTASKEEPAVSENMLDTSKLLKNKKFKR